MEERRGGDGDMCGGASGGARHKPSQVTMFAAEGNIALLATLCVILHEEE